MRATVGIKISKEGFGFIAHYYWGINKVVELGANYTDEPLEDWPVVVTTGEDQIGTVFVVKNADSVACDVSLTSVITTLYMPRIVVDIKYDDKMYKTPEVPYDVTTFGITVAEDAENVFHKEELMVKSDYLNEGNEVMLIVGVLNGRVKTYLKEIDRKENEYESNECIG